ncbi:hypothetical protein B0T10DRAFT_555203 [Thelonectria olida]|uniref:Uncharacterized protein n=1 Tax=Thelonectria olida TaxID=1576542 RepID=A0A9P9AU92_9HYPO|nr:hypothetical protein B0T10DRAFT_555203 [Thelonectria olida]
MGKFSFPSRKKQPPQVLVTAPAMSKAQKILGSTALNIDGDFSTSKVSLATSERSVAAASYASSIRGNGNSRPQREYGDESDIVPRQFRSNARPATARARTNAHPHDEDYDSFDEYGDLTSDMTSVLRKRQSSSTLASWYDKSKQPLSISQQTSSSAMAKGLPTKAQKMLDMDHTLSNTKIKKKPAKLDLSHLMSRRGKKNNQQKQTPPWEGPILGADQLVKSPSLVSPSSSTLSIRGRLTKRPTKESLRSMQSEPAKAACPDPSHSHRGQNHLDGLPNLYEHYEQMSFHQILNQDLRSEDALDEEKLNEQPEPQTQKAQNTTVNKSGSNLHLPHHEAHVVSQYAKRTLPQTPQASLFTKPETSSPTDCAASVSSRHTRTSKASKRTDRSFQESDLQEKSVLSLSSDSEDEMYIDSSFNGPSSVPDYPASDAGSLFDQRPATSRTSQSADNKRFSKASSKMSQRTSQATSSNFLTIPNGNVKPPTISARSSSLSGSSANTIQEGTIARSPSQMSCISNTSSVNTTMTWQSKAGLGLYQARAITMQAAQGPSESEIESPFDVEGPEKQQPGEDDEFDTSHIQYVPHDSILSNGDQPTPPLSPSSVDFYIRSAHSSIDGQATNHNRIMAVTRQEEMLLAALRHKRQVMRENILNETEDSPGADKSTSHMPKGHVSKPSEATITESSFDLDFPAPPMCKDKTTVTADGTTVIDLRHGTSGHLQVPTKPVPALPSSKKALLKAQKKFRSEGHDRILLYLDDPAHDENGSIEESEPSPDLSDFMEFETEESESSRDVVSEVILYPSQTRRPFAERSASMRRPEPVKAHKGFSRSPERAVELGVPRPDSPISPDPLTAIPRRGTVNKKTARLSAVGPARWGYED